MADIGQQIHVAPKYIIAIEESRYRDLPGLVYARQFVRRYAEALATDVAMAMDIFDREYQVVTQAKPSGRPLLTPRAQTEFAWYRRHFRLIVAAFLILTVGTYIAIQAARNFLPPQLVVFDPTGDLSTTAMNIAVKGWTDPNATVTINDQDVQTSGDGKFNESIDLHLGLNTLKISAIKKHSSARIITRQVLVETPK